MDSLNWRNVLFDLLLHSYAIVTLGIVTERIGRGLPFDVRLGIQAVIMIPIILAICIAFYRLIEQPCMYPDWPTRIRNYARYQWRRVRFLSDEPPTLAVD